MNGGAMKIKKALQENRDCNDAAGQDRPHKQPALLDVINHGGYSLSAFLEARQVINGRVQCEAWAWFWPAWAKQFQKLICRWRRTRSNWPASLSRHICKQSCSSGCRLLPNAFPAPADRRHHIYIDS